MRTAVDLPEELLDLATGRNPMALRTLDRDAELDHLSQGLGEVIARCTEYDPKRRYETAAEAEHAFAALAGGTVVVPDPIPPARSPAPSRRGLMLGGAGLLAAGAWWLSGGDGPAATAPPKAPAAAPVAPPAPEKPPAPTTPAPAPPAAPPGLVLDSTSTAVRRTKVILPGNVELPLVVIPPGKFWMGSGGGARDERPRRLITITQPYAIGLTPVTQAQWAAIAGGAGLNADPSYFKGANRPVERVTWDDVQKWLAALGEGARLPTEAEWERVCRAGTTTKWSRGDDEARLGDYAWYDKNANGETHDVATKKPNPWGLFDVHGNVWEWCQDWKDTYDALQTEDPQGAPDGGLRVERGGCFGSSAVRCRSASRGVLSPGSGYKGVGFRVVLSPPPST